MNHDSTAKSTQNRVIFHVDGNNFYASCECLLRPELKDVPMAVAGDPDSRHGIILAKNQRAKQYGVKTAELIWQAERKCPDLVLVPPHREVYSRISKQMNELFLRYTDLVEPASIDESYLDVTGSLHLFGGEPLALADRIRKEVREELGITVSVGVSFCKVFAKLGSDYKKPDATTYFPRSQVSSLIWPMPVGNLLYVGGRFQAELARFHIHTIGDLARADLDWIRTQFGIRGESAWRCARGEDHEPVRSFYEPREAKSIGNSITFRRNLTDEREIRLGFTTLAESVALRMRRQEVHCRRVQIQIRDANFHTLSRQITLERSVCLAKELTDLAMELAGEIWDFQHPVRLLSLTAESLVPASQDMEQLTFFPDTHQAERQKQGRLEDAMCDIRDRFGSGSIRLGGFLKNDLNLGQNRMPPSEDADTL